MIIPIRLPKIYKRTWSCFATPLAVPKIWRCYAIFWPLRHPRLAASATGSARRRSPARACLGQVLSNKKRNSHQNGDCFFLAGAEGLGLACRLGRCFCILRMQRSPPETRTPRHAPRALVQDLFLQKTDTFRHPFLSWQGQKDLNPRHVVLETTALPTELYPYIKLVGHQGLEPRTDRLWAGCSNQLSYWRVFILRKWYYIILYLYCQSFHLIL